MFSICFPGKTDDAKVSEKGCLPPRSSGLQPCSDVCRDDTRKPPLSSSTSSRGSQTPTTTFGFKKQTAILSGSATLGKLPKSLGSFQGGRSTGLCRQSSVDDAYLPIGSSGGGSIGVSRGSLQYRSLPRPSRLARSSAAGTDASLRTATLPKGRSASAATKAVGASLSLASNGVGGSSNQTDREKGSEVGSLKTGGQGQTGSGKQAGGKYSEMSSPTLRRLVFLQLQFNFHAITYSMLYGLVCVCVYIHFHAIRYGISWYLPKWMSLLVDA